MNGSGILTRHQVRIIDESQTPYRLSFGTREAPTLERKIEMGRDPRGQSIAIADIEKHRIGVIDPVLSGVSLHCIPVAWSEFEWMRSKAFRDTLPQRERFHCLAVSCLVKTADGLYIVALRTKRVSTYIGHWHVSAAGYVDIETARSAGAACPQILTELDEEVGIQKHEVITLRQLGLCMHMLDDSAGIEICYEGQTTLHSGIVLERAQKARDAWEGDIFAVSRERLITTLETESFNPAGAATAVMSLGL